VLARTVVVPGIGRVGLRPTFEVFASSSQLLKPPLDDINVARFAVVARTRHGELGLGQSERISRPGLDQWHRLDRFERGSRKHATIRITPRLTHSVQTNNDHIYLVAALYLSSTSDFDHQRHTPLCHRSVRGILHKHPTRS